MKNALLERELLAVVKQLEGDLSSPCSPQEMQLFIDQSLERLAEIEQRLIIAIQQKESKLSRFVFDIAVVMSLGVIIFYTINK